MHLTTSFLQPCVQAFTSISGFLLLLLLFHRLIRNLLFLLSTFYSPLPSPSLNHRPLPLVYLFHPICSPHLPSVFGHQFLPSSRAAPDFICSPGIPFQLLARLLARLLACLLTHTIKCTPGRCSNFFYEMKFDAVLVQFFPTKISHFRSPFHGSEGRIRTHTHTHTRSTRRDTFFFFFFSRTEATRPIKAGKRSDFTMKRIRFPLHRGETRVKRTDTRPSTPSLEIRSSVVHSQIVIANLFNSPIPYRTSVGNKFIDSFVLTNETGRGWKMVGFDGNRTSLFATVYVCAYTRVYATLGKLVMN